MITNRVVAIEATIYNAFGKEIKKLKEILLTKVWLVDGFHIYSDDRRVLWIMSVEYPFTFLRVKSNF
jgi:hypothetical protein